MSKQYLHLLSFYRFVVEFVDVDCRAIVVVGLGTPRLGVIGSILW